MRTVSLVALLMQSALPAAAQSSSTTLTAEQWRSDLAYFAKELPARHKDPFTRVTRTDFEKQAADLDSHIPKLSEMEIRVGFLKLIAAIGDGHTNIQSWGHLPPMRVLPLSLYWFKDCIFVIAATEPYRNLLGARLARIGKVSVEDACRTLSALAPHENDAVLKQRLPNSFLTNADLLQTMGMAGTGESVHFELRSRGGENIALEVPAISANRTEKRVMAFEGEQPLYRKNALKPYWATTIDNGSTVYFEYNSCTNDPKSPFSEFRPKLKETLSQSGVKRLVVDLRLNGGGNSAILDPWISEIKWSALNKKGSLFVIIGRSTFSSAILNALRLRNETAATLIGEPTAGKPNHFGEVRAFELPNSSIKVSYSTKYFRESDDDTPSLMPDILVEQTSADYLAGRDPVLDVIISSPRK
jgi:hypothetical protein